MTALLNWRAWAALALAVFLVGTHWKAYHSGTKSGIAECNAEKLAVAEQALKLAEQAKRTTLDLQAKADTLRKAKDEQIAKLGTDLARALDGLRDRPARPDAGGVPGDTGAGAGCTGATLWRDDGEFLTRLAARADRLRLDLGQCQQAYQAARDALK